MKVINELIKEHKQALSQLAENVNHIGHIVNVKYFGAIGDGVADDSKSINDCIAYASINKKIVEFEPNKVYRCKNILLRDDTLIKGNNAILKSLDNSSSTNDDKLVRGENISNIFIENLKLDGNIDVVYGDDKNGVTLLDLRTSKDIKIIGCSFLNNKYLAITLMDINAVLVNKCNFKNIDCGIIAQRSYLKNATFTENMIDGHEKSEGISLWCSTDIYNVVIQGNTILNKKVGNAILLGREGTFTTNIHSITVSNNIIDNCASGIVALNCKKSNIQNNIITNTFSAVKSENCTECIISQNNIENTKHMSIYLKNSNFNMINNNAIKDCNSELDPNILGYGFINVDNSNNNSILNNKFINTLDHRVQCKFVGISNEFIDNNYSNLSTNTSNDCSVFLSGTFTTNKNNKIKAREDIRVFDQVTKDNGFQPNFVDKANVYTFNVTSNNVEHYNNIGSYRLMYTNNNLTNFLFENLALDYNGKEIIIMFSTKYSCQLATTGNIVWKDSTIKQVEANTNRIFKLVCNGNKWYEI